MWVDIVLVFAFIASFCTGKSAALVWSGLVWSSRLSDERVHDVDQSGQIVDQKCGELRPKTV